MNQNKVVLVVDDDEDVLNILTLFLRKKGFLITTAKDGNEARSIIDTANVDLVISDIRMPECSGLELLRWVKKNTNVPIIIMTGFQELLETQIAHDVGVNYFLPKPFKGDDLLALMKLILEGHKSSPAGDDEYTRRPNQDEHFTEISMTEFLTGSKYNYPIYLRLSKAKYIKIAHSGENLNKERIQKLMNKGIHCLFLRKDHYNEYVEHMKKLAEIVKISKKIPPEKKEKFMWQLGEVIANHIYHKDIDEESYNEAKEYFEKTMDTYVEEQTVYDLLAFLNEIDDDNNSFMAHQLGLSIYSVFLAKKIGWTSDRMLSLLSMGGMFANIGQKDLPRGMLHKDPRLFTQAEQQLFHDHPVHGVELLNSYHQFSPELLQLILQHHENCRGTGYPFGLNRGSITEPAKLLFIIDLFCDFVIKTPFNDPVPPKEAIRVMEKNHMGEMDKKMFTVLKQSVVKTKDLEYEY